MADDLLLPKQIGFSSNTSDVVLYDGASFATIAPGSAPSLNSVLFAVDTELTTINTTIAGLTAHISDTVGLTNYSGTKIYPGFTWVGVSLNDIMAEIGTLVSSNLTNFNTLDTTEVATGAATPLMQTAPYTVGPAPTDSDEAFIALDSAIQNLYTDKYDLAISLQITNSAFSSYIVSSLDAAIGGGAFEVDIPIMSFYYAPSSAAIQGGLVANIAAETIIVPALSDSYIDYSLTGSVYVLTSVANGAAEPVVAANSVRVTKAITDGVAVTSIVASFADRQSVGGIHGNIKRESVGTTQITDGAITNPKLAVSGVAPATYSFVNATFNNKGLATAAVSEVNFTALADLDFMKYDSGSGLWLNVPLVGGILPAGLGVGNVIEWDGGAWISAAPIAFTAIPLSGTAAPITGDLEVTGGTKIFRLTSDITWNDNDITVTGDDLIISSTLFTVNSDATFVDNVNVTNSLIPAAPLTNGFSIYAAERDAIAGKSAMHILTETGDEHIFGDLVGIGTVSPHASAALDIRSTTGGVRVPNVTTGERDIINAGVFADGLIVFNTSVTQFQGWNGVAWVNLG